MNLFEEWTLKEDFKVALDYALEHLKDWPDEIRHLKSLSLRRRLPTFFPLVRSLLFSREGMKKFPKKFLQVLELNLLTRLSLVGCRDLVDYSGLEKATKLLYFKAPIFFQQNAFQHLPANITSLDLLQTSWPTSLEPLVHLKQLRSLAIYSTVYYD